MFAHYDHGAPSLSDMIPILDELKVGDPVVFEPAFSYHGYSSYRRGRSNRSIFRGTVTRMTEASLFVRPDAGNEYHGTEFRFRIKPTKWGEKFEQVNGRGSQLFPKGHELAEQALAKDIERNDRDDRIAAERNKIDQFTNERAWRSSENIEAMAVVNASIAEFRLALLADQKREDED